MFVIIGSGCLRVTDSCDPTSVFAVITENGLDATFQFFVDQCRALGKDNIQYLDPSTNLAWKFLAEHVKTDLMDGMETSSNLFTEEAMLYCRYIQSAGVNSICVFLTFSI
jgi:hypothetical protein